MTPKRMATPEVREALGNYYKDLSAQYDKVFHQEDPDLFALTCLQTMLKDVDELLETLDWMIEKESDSAWQVVRAGYAYVDKAYRELADSINGGHSHSTSVLNHQARARAFFNLGTDLKFLADNDSIYRFGTGVDVRP